MSPTALDAPEHHDSFTLPSGSAQPAASNDDVHASARRSPAGGLIKVDSEDTVYDEEGITSRFTDRGAEVTSEFEGVSTRSHGLMLPLLSLIFQLGRHGLTPSEDAQGRLKVTKTEKHFEFHTNAKVGRVG